MAWQSFQREKRVSCQVTVGVGVTGIDVSANIYIYIYIYSFTTVLVHDLFLAFSIALHINSCCSVVVALCDLGSRCERSSA